jgi:2-polyprenyl-3-methyl-5-hydroxy-6-metoxy-1,4-benzoquinol methylase
MEKRLEVLTDFYKNRKDKDNLNNHVVLDRFITLNYLKKFINKKHDVVEIGSGIRNYSADLSKLAKSVTAIDIMKDNIEIINSMKIKNLKGIVGDAVNLYQVDDKSFDVVFINGVMSHLFNEQDRIKAIKESIRICKDNGYIIYSYLSNTSLIVRYGLLKNNLEKLNKKFTKDFSIKNTPSDLYSTYYVDQFNEMFDKLNVKHLVDVSTDGIFEILKENTNNLSKEDFGIVKNLQLGICERKDMIGVSTHILSIFKKL